MEGDIGLVGGNRKRTEIDGVDGSNLTAEGLHAEGGHDVADISVAETHVSIDTSSWTLLVDVRVPPDPCWWCM